MKPEDPKQHPVVRRAVRILRQRGDTPLGQWDELTVKRRSIGWRKGWWYTITAVRHPGTLAQTTVVVFIATSGPLRGRFCGGYRDAIMASTWKIRTWRDLQVKGW